MTLSELLVTIAILGVLVALLILVFRKAREAARPQLHNATLLLDGAPPATIVRGETYVLSGEFDLETAEMEVPFPMMVDLITIVPEHGQVTACEAWVSATRVRGRHCTFTGELTMNARAHGAGELRLIYFDRRGEGVQKAVFRTPVVMEDPARASE
jgi:hypothetical protein